jgi:hypothetical protein
MKTKKSPPKTETPKQSPKRMAMLKKYLDRFNTIIRNNNWSGKTRQIASYVFCMALFEQDIIFQTSLMGQRDIGIELGNFIKLYSK